MNRASTVARLISWLIRRVRKIAVLIAVGLFVGWFYGWASARFYPVNKRVGFGHGVLHGALMPMALPGLLMGKNEPIYATKNTGRSYKLGYIVGINACGLLFFGLLFWRPAPGKGSDASSFRRAEYPATVEPADPDQPSIGK